MRGGTISQSQQSNAVAKPFAPNAVAPNSGAAKPVEPNSGAKPHSPGGLSSLWSYFFKPKPPEPATVQSGGRRRRKTKRVKFRRRKSVRR